MRLIAAGPPTIRECISRSLLRPVFQPIVSLSNGTFPGYETLVRGPVDSAIESAGSLFKMAAEENCVLDLELFAARIAVETFASSAVPGKLFVNFSPDAVRKLASTSTELLAFLEKTDFEPTRVVVEITEHTEVGCITTLKSSVAALRGLGLEVALDDYGVGNATLSLWAAIAPNYLKIDRSLVSGVASSPFQLEVLRGTQRLAEIAGAVVIAEGIEDLDDLAVCRDLGIPFAQGYAIGRPTSSPATAAPGEVLEAIAFQAIAVFPVQGNVGSPTFSSAGLVVHAPTVTMETTNNDVFEKFLNRPDIHALAVTKHNQPT